MTAADWIRDLGLLRHAEGGYYRETYRASLALPAEALPGDCHGGRSASTAIYFLLEAGDISALHRLRADELWHFYAGDPLTLHLLFNDGTYERQSLGPRPEQGQSFQVVIPAGTWFGATVEAPGAYALTGCTVSPGFDFDDFELGVRSELLARIPQHGDLIRRLTRQKQ